MKHRGKQASDDKYFNAKWQTILTEASADLSFLLGKGYGYKSSLALVGSHYKLGARQQRALSLITCPSHKIALRRKKSLSAKDLHGRSLVIDGFNLLITVETMLSGGFILVGQDGCHRDLSSIHGTYKKVVETESAIALIDNTLKALGVTHVLWYFDQPVSNSGMLKALLYEYAADNNSPWNIELVMNPDKALIENEKIVVSCDSWVIDECAHFVDLARLIKHELIHSDYFIELLDFELNI